MCLMDEPSYNKGFSILIIIVVSSLEEVKGSLGSQLSSYSAEENEHAIANKCVNLQKQLTRHNYY